MGRAQRVQAFSPQRGVSERNRRTAAALSAEMGEFTLHKHLKLKGAPRGLPMGIGMTDPFAIEQFTKLFISMAWTVKYLYIVLG